MKYTLRGIPIILMLTFLGALTAMAQESAGQQGVETIAVMARMIRWSGVVASALVISGAWLLLRAVDRLVSNLGSIFAERRLLMQKVNAFFHFGVYLVTVITIVLLSFEISNEVLIILGGGVAVAMGFALKDLVASLMAGVIIMLDRQFQVGDRVTFGGQYGDITSIGPRSVKMQTLDDNTVTIPNNLFLNQIAASGNFGALDMQVVIDFHISVDEDGRQVQRLVRESAVTSCYVFLPKPVTVRVSQVVLQHCVALRLRLKVYVLDTKYEKALVSDITLRVLEAFAAADIRPPAIMHRNATDRSLEVALPAAGPPV